jgi:LPXTG-motif cell wall-anchored protein
MNRALRAAVFGLAAVAAALSVPAGATAAPKPSADLGPISATAGPLDFEGNPWAPSGTLAVTVHNGSHKALKGHFLLQLTESAYLVPGQCKTFKDDDYSFVCGGDLLGAGADKTYRLRINSDVDGVQFEASDKGRVVGIELEGGRGAPDDFAINWPRRMPLSLVVAQASAVGGKSKVDVTVTNQGTFAIGGYSLAVRLPKGVSVAGCDTKLKREGASCEVYRGKGLKAGAVDRFSLTTTVGSGPKNVTFYLTPGDRYTNEDTSVTLALGGAAEATATPAPTLPVTPEPGTDPELPKTGVNAVALAAGGAGVLGLGALLFVIARRRRVTFN